MDGFLSNQLIFPNSYFTPFSQQQLFQYQYAPYTFFSPQQYIQYPVQQNFPYQYQYPTYIQPKFAQPNTQENCQVYEEVLTTGGTRRQINETLIMSQRKVSGENLDKNLIHQYITLILEDDKAIEEIILKLEGKQQINFSQTLITISKKVNEQCKSREEIVKYCLRKAFRYIFQSIQKTHDKSSIKYNYKETNLKQAREIFQNMIEKERHMKLTLPFRKNSINKTMNSDFLKEIFSSSIFQHLYKEFLNDLDSIITKDCVKKINKLSEQLFCNSKNEKQEDINFKRLPWSRLNIEKVKQIATDLLEFAKIPQELQ